MYVYLGERINDQGKGKNMHVLFIYLSHSFVFVLLVSCFIKYVFIFRNKMHTNSMDESVFFFFKASWGYHMVLKNLNSLEPIN